MKESILTIPVNEVFEPRRGCPVCAVRNAAEEHISEYIMGAAMMEPDVRIEQTRRASVTRISTVCRGRETACRRRLC